MAVDFLSRDHLAGLEQYKYNAVDTNPVSVYIMHPFWNAVVKLCPKWLAPNLLTFSGFMFTVLNFVILSYYDYYFYASNSLRTEYEPIPSWVWIVCAFNHFLAYTLDGIDGKQARRTNTSGPIGEMFDHGLDSWTTVFIPCYLYAIFGRDDFSIPALEFYTCLCVVQITFLSSHWEKYNTGVLYLPWCYDISQIPNLILAYFPTIPQLTFILFIITYFKGYTFWKMNIPILNISTGLSVKYGLYIGSFGFSLPMSLYCIYKSYRDRTGKMRSFYEANRPLVSCCLFIPMCYFWIYFSPNNVFVRDPRCYYIMTGTVISNICCRLIVSQMTNTRCDLLNWLLTPVALVIGLAMFFTTGNPEMEVLLLRLLTALVILSHVHYGVCVIRQMCKHFNIDVFSIKRSSQD